MPHDSDDFDEFFRGEFSSLVAFLRRLGYESSASEDAAAEAMSCAFRSWGRLEAPRAWVRVAAQRIALRELRRQRRLGERAALTELTAQSFALDPSDMIAGRFRVIALLAILPPQQREVMTWRLDGFQTCEIAASLGISEATVRSTVRHARKLLQKKLVDELDQGPREEGRGYGS